MTDQPINELRSKRCKPCEGGVAPTLPEDAQRMLRDLPGWEMTSDGKRIRKEWTVSDFLAGMDFLNRVADVAEEEGHHPDVHLASYRSLTIELWTHAIGGLSENDFIMAAKIDAVPIKLLPPRTG